MLQILCIPSSGSASKAEKLINRDYKTCKKKFIEAVEYMVKCYTSASQIEHNIKELLIIKDTATKLITHQEAIVNSSKSINTAKAVGNNFRKNDKTSP